MQKVNVIMAQTPPRVIFTHVPKSAGSTMKTVLYRQYHEKMFQFYAGVYGTTEQLLRAVVQKSETNPDALQAISGHVPYGLHNRIQGQWQYFIILRDPVKRALSAYFYARSVSNHPKHDDALRLSAVEYLAQNPSFATLHIRYLLGMPADKPNQAIDAHAVLPDNALEIAKQRLVNDYTAFGLTERLDESLLLLREVFGWRNIYYESRNITRGKPTSTPVETVDALREACALDIALYDYAKGLFEERLQQTFGDRLPALLATFQRNNRLYNQARGMKDRVLSVARLKR